MHPVTFFLAFAIVFGLVAWAGYTLGGLFA